jgi:hypothetical protein
MQTQPTTGAHRVLIVGAGFGGLFAARFLKRARKQLAHLFPVMPNRSGCRPAGSRESKFKQGDYPLGSDKLVIGDNNAASVKTGEKVSS